VTLRVGVSGGPVSFRWFRDGLPLANGKSATYSIPNAQPANSGAYYVVCTNLHTVVTSSVTVINILPDRTGPKVLHALANHILPSTTLGLNSIIMPFSETMVSSPANGVSSVRNPNNYVITQLGTIHTIGVTQVLYSTELGALLFPDRQDPDWVPYGDYVVTINNVTDTKGHAIAPDTTVPVAWRYATNLIQSGHVWTFHASSVIEPGVYEQPWFAYDYVPGPFWGEGIGPFYGGTIISPPCPVLGAPQSSTGWQREPILFRTIFTYSEHWPLAATLSLVTTFDDGLVLYLNGSEIYRNNVMNAPGSRIHADLRSLASMNQAACLTNINIGVTNLLPGTNCLAAAVVQWASVGGDSDSYFALEMEASIINTSKLPAEQSPVLHATFLDTDALRLSWTGNGYALESSTNLNTGSLSYPAGPWTEVPQMANPYIWSLTNGLDRYFRLKK